MNELLLVSAAFGVVIEDKPLPYMLMSETLSVVARRVNSYNRFHSTSRFGFSTAFKTAKIRQSEDGKTLEHVFTKETYRLMELGCKCYWVNEKTGDVYESLQHAFTEVFNLYDHGIFTEKTYDFISDEILKQLHADFPESNFAYKVVEDLKQKYTYVKIVETEKPEDPCDDPDNYDEKGNFVEVDNSDGF